MKTGSSTRITRILVALAALPGFFPCAAYADGSDDWEDMGMATLEDGWVLPYFRIDGHSYPYKVALQRSRTRPTLYRLADPYHSGPAAEFNEAEKGGAIVFDVADPEHVVFLKADAGFALREAGIETLYCYNALGSLMKQTGLTAGEVILREGGGILYTTFTDGVVELSSVRAGRGMKNDANFGYQRFPDGGMQWYDVSGFEADMSARIIFPSGEEEDDGVKTVADVADGEPLYFTLQGVPLANPAPGTIVVCLRGGKAIKIRL